jgi:xanthine/CO dehydrogenase XdhC/CoxF family maturation factor
MTAHTAQTLLVVGDGEVAAALEAMSTALGWCPVVVDTLLDTERELPEADLVVVLSHHDDVDGPAIAAALEAAPVYIGAMGSRRTQERRRAWLLAHGVSEERIAAVHGPAGLDIGANTPAEIALSILAEAVATLRSSRRSRDTSSGAAEAAHRSLRDRPGPIHPDLPAGTAECPAG